MSDPDSSEDEDLSKFKEAVDNSFTKLIDESRGKSVKEEKPRLKSERYLEISSHYNDVKVPEEMQKRIGAKVSAIIDKNIEFVDVQDGVKKHKIKGGVKLFKDSENLLSCEEVKDTYTENHNSHSKRIRLRRSHTIDPDDIQDETEKIKAVAVSGEYILSQNEIKYWKSRRKEKLFRYKSESSVSGTVLTAVEIEAALFTHTRYMPMIVTASAVT